MKRNVLVIGLSLAFGLVMLAARARSDEQHKHAPEMSPEQKAMMEACIKAGTPGAEHERFKARVGKWKAECKTWMGTEEPSVSSGSSTFELFFEGRYLHQTYAGEWDGIPFEGRGVSGYDNIKKKYFGAWIDSMSTALTVLEGDYDPATKTTTMSGPGLMPDGSPYTMRTVDREVNPNTFVFEMYMPGPDGKEVKNMEITYTRM